MSKTNPSPTVTQPTVPPSQNITGPNPNQVGSKKKPGGFQNNTTPTTPLLQSNWYFNSIWKAALDPKNQKIQQDLTRAEKAVKGHDLVLAHNLLGNPSDRGPGRVYGVEPAKQIPLFNLYKDPKAWLDAAEFWLKYGDVNKAQEHLRYARKIIHGVVY